MKHRAVLMILFLAFSALFLSGCDVAVLNPKGIIAIAEKQMLIDAVLLMSLIVVPVLILTVIIARRYRASNTKAAYRPDWSHNVWLEVVWWSIPLIIIVCLATMTWKSAHKLDPYRPLDSTVKPIEIDVVALDWRWLFIYPEQKIATVNLVAFPVNTPVNFYLTADAPMNSFQIPQLAGQIYAMPAMRTQLHLMANAIGDYAGRSTNFSGDGFANMIFTARALSQADFDAWVTSVKQSPQALTLMNYTTLAKPSEYETPLYFSSVEEGLFDKIIMKFMMPDSTMPVSETRPPLKFYK